MNCCLLKIDSSFFSELPNPNRIQVPVFTPPFPYFRSDISICLLNYWSKHALSSEPSGIQASPHPKSDNKKIW